MSLGGILSRKLTGAFKNVSNIFKPMRTPVRSKHVCSKVYSKKDVEKMELYYFLANKDVFDKLNAAEFNHFIMLTLGRQYDSLDLRELFNSMDENKDEYIQMREIRDHFSKGLCEQKTGDLMYAFCRFDKDFDDYIFLHEARQALFYLGYFHAGDPRIKDIFYSRDSNDDKRLSYPEFATIIKDMDKLL